MFCTDSFMPVTSPELLLLNWLEELPKTIADTLVARYLFMISANSEDFVLRGEEAWKYFKHLLTEPDFPLRRVARLLTLRAQFSFLLELSDSNNLVSLPPTGQDANLYPLDSAQILRARQRWRKFCESGLSDAALQSWLLDMQC
jgi:hypothetical protein